MLDQLPMLNVLVRDEPLESVVALRGDNALTRREFLHAVRSWISTLQDHPAQRIALFSVDSFSFATALFACWACGRTVLLPGDALPETCKQLRSRVDAFIGDFPSACEALTANDAASATNLPALSGEAFQLEVFTSGSTGAPVAIAKRLRQLAHEVATLESLFGADLAQAVVRATVSHQHIYGLLFRILWPLSAQRPFDCTSMPFAEDMAKLGPRAPFVLIASPAHLKRLHAGNDWQATAAQLQRVFSSGGPLMPEAAELCHQQLGQHPVEVYGSSETGGIAWRVRHTHGDTWTCMPGITIAQHADDCLAVISPHLPDNTPFETADRVRLQDVNRFELLGRADRIAKIEEKRVSLSAIESRLCESPHVREARVLVLEATGTATREQLAAVVVLTSGHDTQAVSARRALSQALREHLAQAFEPAALPRRWRFVEALPINEQGKVTHQSLRQLFDEMNPTTNAATNTDALATRPRQPQISLQSRDDTSVSQHWYIPEDLFYFEGHFPGTPILAGVVQLNWAIEQGRALFPIAGEFLRLEALKFQQPIMPKTTLEVSLSWKAENRSLTFALRSASGPHASGRVVFSNAGAST